MTKNSSNSDLTVNECKAAFARGDVVWVDKHPNQMSIIFITKTSDKFHVVSNPGGKIRRFKSRMDLDITISIIKGL